MKHKRILFWGYNYMNYCSFIREELNAQIGETVYCSLEFPRWMRLFRQFSSKFYAKALYRYHLSQINRVVGQHFDYVYFIHAKAMDISLVHRLKDLFPNAKFILYYWDSINKVDYRSYIPLFDKVFSFDSQDCEENPELAYLPLFYTNKLLPDCQTQSSLPKYDLAYIVSITQERRYQYLVGLREYAKKNNLKLYEYAVVYSKTYIQYFLKQHKLMKGVHFKSIALKRVYDVFDKSKVIVDFPNNFQSGLTMRTFETLGMRKKLLTSNENIKKEALYSPENIFITPADQLDRIPLSFFKDPFCPNSAIEDYSLSSWVRKQFQDK